MTATCEHCGGPRVGDAAVADSHGSYYRVAPDYPGAMEVCRSCEGDLLGTE